MTNRAVVVAVAALPLTLSAITLSAFSAPPKTPAKPTKTAAKAPSPDADARRFLSDNCYACHNGETKQGGLDLIALRLNPSDPKTFALWVKLHDRVRDGEMPPPAMGKLDTTVRSRFLSTISAPLTAADIARERRDGRATWRRMNRYEYENSVRDLLGAPWLQIREMLPEDGQAMRFNKVGDALDVSHVQMSRYLTAAEYALREAMAKQATRPETVTKRYYARNQGSFLRPAREGGVRGTFPILGDEADTETLQALKSTDGPKMATFTTRESDPSRREREAIGMVASAYEPIEPKFERFRAPVSGRYKIRLCGHSFWSAPDDPKRWWNPSQTRISKGRTLEPVDLYSEAPPRQLRRLGAVDVKPESTVGELDVYLLKGETIRPDAVRLFRSRPPAWHNPLSQPDGTPGVAFQWLEVTGPIYDAWPTEGQRLLFGDLPMTADAAGRITVTPRDIEADTTRLMRAFLKRAYRRPVEETDVQSFVTLARTARATGMDFTDSMLTAYSGVLCSPAFVTLQEKPGRLDDRMLATRLSYFLWNSPPDATLRTIAERSELRKPGVLRRETERMLADPRAERFIEAFLDYWLELRKVNNNSPDEALYPDYYLDDFLVESSLDETRAFFGAMLRDNLPARNLVASNFVMVNERLADLYGIPGVKGAKIRRVALPPDSPRGGLLTQASVLKVTANGTTTSPVIRGAWITERILGQPVPPPPPSVPAVEPDTRGATTIREQLAKHRTEATCNSCHAKIDPPGFALENFDVCGGWRDKYRALGDSGEKVPGYGKNGQAFAFHLAQPIDASGTLNNGSRFREVRAYKNLLLKDERQIARNLARQFVIYGTGAPVSFGDRPRIEAILDRAKPSGYGTRSLIHAIVESELFQNK